MVRAQRTSVTAAQRVKGRSPHKLLAESHWLVGREGEEWTPSALSMGVTQCLGVGVGWLDRKGTQSPLGSGKLPEAWGLDTQTGGENQGS